jgi:hypothetical protein
VEVSSIAAAAPHRQWLLPAQPAAAALEEVAAATGGPLSALLALFNAAVGHDADLHVALALLVSAAAAGGAAAEGGMAAACVAGSKARGVKRQVGGPGRMLAGAGGVKLQPARQHGLNPATLPPHPSPQINVLVLHDDDAPQALRLLRAAAQLLSPQVRRRVVPMLGTGACPPLAAAQNKLQPPFPPPA